MENKIGKQNKQFRSPLVRLQANSLGGEKQELSWYKFIPLLQIGGTRTHATEDAVITAE